MFQNELYRGQPTTKLVDMCQLPSKVSFLKSMGDAIFSKHLFIYARSRSYLSASNCRFNEVLKRSPEWSEEVAKCRRDYERDELELAFIGSTID